MNSPRNDNSGPRASESARESELLVRSIADGDRDAERAFAERYLRPVRAILLARTRNREIVGDLAQEVIMGALCALRRGQIREPAKLTSFVVGVAGNVLNHYFRNESRRPEPLEFPDDLPDISTSAAQIEDQQREALALKAIASLDPVDKKILEMTLVEGLKPGVIAQRLGLNSNMVRQRKLRATRRVIDYVQQQSQSEVSDHLSLGQKR